MFHPDSLGTAVETDMNQLTSAGMVRVDEHTGPVSKDDIADARSWCEKRVSELPVNDARTGRACENRKIFVRAIQDLDTGNIRYSTSEPNGLHYSLLLAFAEGWRKNRG